jgi:hypothetical protein
MDFPAAERAGVSLRSLPAPIFLLPFGLWIAHRAETGCGLRIRNGGHIT